MSECEASVNDGRDDDPDDSPEAQLESEGKIVLTSRLDYLELTDIARHASSYLAEAIEASSWLDLVVDYDARALVITQPCVELDFEQLI